MTIERYLTPLGFLLPGRELAISLTCVEHECVQTVHLLLDGQVVAQVAGVDDLMGHACVSSPAMALRYVRFFTSPSTAHSLVPTQSCADSVGSEAPDGPVSYEVVPFSLFANDKSFVFGLDNRPGDIHLGELRWAYRDTDTESFLGRPSSFKQLSLWRRRRRFRWYGILRDEEWRRNRLRPPEVEPASDGFVVKRMLVTLGPHGWADTAYWACERVTTDGRVARTKINEVRLRGGILVVGPVLH